MFDANMKNFMASIVEDANLNTSGMH